MKGQQNKEDTSRALVSEAVKGKQNSQPSHIQDKAQLHSKAHRSSWIESNKQFNTYLYILLWSQGPKVLSSESSVS